MTRFLIQTIYGEVIHDFAWVLIQSCKYQNWYYNNNDLSYELVNDISDGDANKVPIGSVEFVEEYIHKFHNGTVHPINVPEELFKFAERKIFNGTLTDIHDKSFVKSNDIIKGSNPYMNIPVLEMNYQISDIVTIDSEYRCFIYDKELRGIYNYAGDIMLFPDSERIKRMVAEYSDPPIAYTLDVGISSGKTVIIEVHNFFSCGLYGFADHRILPQMFNSAFNEVISKYMV